MILAEHTISYEPPVNITQLFLLYAFLIAIFIPKSLGGCAVRMVKYHGFYDILG